jgi:hypothetical protein
VVIGRELSECGSESYTPSCTILFGSGGNVASGLLSLFLEF